MKKYNFISGLPRAGSTLLASILKQNPRFTAGISDPLQMYIHSIIRDTNTAAGMDKTVSIDRRREIVKSIVDSFYSQGNEVCFNTNRGWSADTALLHDLYPDFKMIVCLRDIPWILDSFEQLNNKNPYTIKPLYHHQELGSVYERTHMLMGNIPNFSGYVSAPLSNVKQSIFCNEKKQIFYLEYDHLVAEPRQVLQQVYDFLQEPWYEHDFNNVEDSYDEFDEQAKIAGLHRVRKHVEVKHRESVIPQDLWQRYENETFWKLNFAAFKQNLNWSTARKAPIFANTPRRAVMPLGKQL
jgi:sulfotransferase